MINLDPGLCNGCLECRRVCPNYVFGVAQGMEQPFVRYAEQCCACGHCIAVCPTDALSHPELSRDQFLPVVSPGISPQMMQALLLSRRSIRAYLQDPVSDEVVEALLAAATHGGTSSNGQTEGFVVIRSRALLKDLESLVVNVLWRAGFKHMASGGLKGRLLELKFGREMVQQYRHYHHIFKHRRENGEIDGIVFRNAPLVIVAHGLKANSLAAANCALALRNVELLALTMGLGTCWVGYLAGAAGLSKKIGELTGVAANRRIWGALMVGYPAEDYRVTMPRKPRQVRYL
jgi:nitroreductase/NAD-dependent dihydropyrimidine dehydrogenase PreA subunit